MAAATPRQSHRFHLFSVVNMALGALVFAVSVYLVISGEYQNLAMRKHAEALLGQLEIGALLYVALFWYLDRFFRPLWFGMESQAR